MFEALSDNPVVARVGQWSRKVYNWLEPRVWPVYSTGMIVSAIAIMAAVNEKQLLADHLFGSNDVLRTEGDETLRKANSLFDDELAKGVKEDVWGMPRAKFSREYAMRHGESIAL